MNHRRRSFVILAMFALSLGGGPAVAQPSSTEIEDITQDVAQTRGLEELRPIEVTVKSREELGQELIDSTEEEYPEDEQYADEREMLAFGLMDEHIDFGDLSTDLYTEQVAGYYDPETGEMVVIREPTEEGGFSATQQVTYAHEVVHALQDQHFDLDGGPLEREDLSDDQSLAVTALIEGDASFSEVQYLIDRPELLEAFLTEIEDLDFDSDVLDTAPPLIAATLLFPYDQGYTFVEAIHAEGGWEAVDAAFANPPASTEQILHPEKFIAGEPPVEVDVPDFTPVLGPDWIQFDDNTFGEYQIQVMLQETSMSDEQAALAAAGWGGDTYIVSGTDSDEVAAIHWKTVWDSDADASEFARAWAIREAERWGVDPTYMTSEVIQFETDGAVARITLDGDTVTYVMAPDLETAERILAVESSPAVASPVATPLATPVATPES